MIHSYACKVLSQKGIKVYSNGRQILAHPYNRVHLPLRTVMKVTESFQRQFLIDKGHKNIREIEELNRLGFKITKFAASGEAFKYQRIGYKIVRMNVPTREDFTCQRIPDDHYVIFDIYNQCIQGIGKNFGMTGRTAWIPIKYEPTIPHRRYDVNPLDLDATLNMAASQLNSLSPFIDSEEVFEIKEIVVGVTEEGHFACVPMPKRTDPPFTLIFGGRGQGKSLLMNNLSDGYFHKGRLYCAYINDIKPETHTHCLEWEMDNQFREELRRYGEPSTPKPAVYLHPTTKENYARIYPDEVGFDVSLPLRHLLRDENLITYNKSWEMKKSASLISWRNLIYEKGKLKPDGLASIETLEEARDLIEREIVDVGMRDKAYRVISDIFNTFMVDKASGLISKWIYEYDGNKYADSAWNVCMDCGLFPYLNTSGVRGEIWFALWLRYVIMDIMAWAKKQSKPTLLFADEIEELLKDKVTRDIIERAIRECRSSKVGLTMVVHNYQYLPDSIYSHSSGNSGYKFIFNTGEQKLITKLKQDGLTKSQAAEIPNLKQFECYAMGNFKLYDSNGTSYWNEGKPIKLIRIKPPNCQHAVQNYMG